MSAKEAMKAIKDRPLRLVIKPPHRRGKTEAPERRHTDACARAQAPPALASRTLARLAGAWESMRGAAVDVLLEAFPEVSEDFPRGVRRTRRMTLSAYGLGLQPALLRGLRRGRATGAAGRHPWKPALETISEQEAEVDVDPSSSMATFLISERAGGLAGGLAGSHGGETEKNVQSGSSMPTLLASKRERYVGDDILASFKGVTDTMLGSLTNLRASEGKTR